MSNIGPRLKKVRALGTPLPGLTRKSADGNPAPPGQHGPAKAARRKKSQYRLLLDEKQKVRFNYGVSERQMRRYMERARASDEPTGEALLAILESRLDNVVFRMGFAPTIPAARQLVVHGHVRVNGSRVDRPGYLLSPGDQVEPTRKGKAIPQVAELLQGPRPPLIPEHLLVDRGNAIGRMVARPPRHAVSVVVREAAIVEFYAR